MKKNISYTFILLLMLFFSNSCTDDFLDVTNPNDLSESSFYQTADDAYYAINTCYYGLAGRGMFGLDYQLLITSFDDRVLFETPNLDEITINSSSDFVEMLYKDLYIGLWRACTFIRAMNENDISDLDEDLKARYVGEAKALRAHYYFYLVTLFNQPVFYDDTDIPEEPRGVYYNGEPIQFWDKIVTDLQEAIPDLPETYGSSDVGRITKGAANALLGKAMLYKHYYYHCRLDEKGSADDLSDLALAEDAFEEVINSGVYGLMQPLEPKTPTDYEYALLSPFSYIDLESENNTYDGENNMETLWAAQYSNDRIQAGWLPAWQWSGALNVQYFSAHGSSYRNHEIHPYLWSEFETEGAPAGFDRDPRAYATCYLDGDIMDYRSADSTYYNVEYTSGINNKSVAQGRGISVPGQPTVGFGLKKYYFPMYYEADAPSNDPVNRVIIRYADVLLMYAEIMYLQGETGGTGLAALNEVRQRVDMPDVEALSVDAIIHERDVELATEGHRFLDLIRWSFDEDWATDWSEIEWGINSENSVNPFVTGKNEFLPIPLYDINLGFGNIEQNPGW